MSSRLVVCPECKFPNIPRASVCLTCKTPLPPKKHFLDLRDEPEVAIGEGGSPDETRIVKRVTDPVTAQAVMRRKPAYVEDPAISPATERAFGSWDETSLIAWLQCEPLPPIPLGPGQSVTMGRGSECDLLLPHPTVSRQHVVVRVEADGIVLEDTSRFGTFVNGKRVKSAHLSVGDNLSVGPYEINVLSSDSAHGREHAADETRPLDRSMIGSDAELMGTLDRVSLLEILQGFEFNRKTGTLKVSSGQRSGMLVVEDGAPIYARYAELQDREAVLAMLGLKMGNFGFWGERAPGDRTMESTLTGLLLDYSRQQDEAG